MIIKKITGFPGAPLLVCVSVWVSCIADANAWKQEYIAIDTKSNTSERYTWDSDHQPRYEDILAERMNASGDVSGLALNAALAPPDNGRGVSVGWNFPLFGGVTSGPVAIMHNDALLLSPTHNVLESAYVNTLGWRVDYQEFWGVHPWAQVSYNLALSADTSGASHAADNNWRDVTFGADMPLSQHLAAWASFSQADNLPDRDNFLYLMGVSAKF